MRFAGYLVTLMNCTCKFYVAVKTKAGVENIHVIIVFERHQQKFLIYAHGT